MDDELDELLTDEEPEAETTTAATSNTLSQDEEDRLRQKSTRVSTSYNAIDEGGSGSAWRSFSPAQRLILAVLVLLNILVIGFGILVVTGRFSL